MVVKYVAHNCFIVTVVYVNVLTFMDRENVCHFCFRGLKLEDLREAVLTGGGFISPFTLYTKL